MALGQVAFLHELLTVGFDVLISDLDVVWLNGHWRRWMTWRGFTPLPEASLIAAADVLVTTDELSAERDVRFSRTQHRGRAPHQGPASSPARGSHLHPCHHRCPRCMGA